MKVDHLFTAWAGFEFITQQRKDSYRKLILAQRHGPAQTEPGSIDTLK